jgi:hypothetical protein
MEKACKHLWAAVLDQAIQDALCEVPSKEGNVEYIFKKKALNWFFSRCEGIGSFLWICNVLDIDPKSVLSLFANTDGFTLAHKTFYASMDS